MGKTALALRHVHFEDVGAYAATLEEAGYDVSYRDAGLDDFAAIEAEEAALLIVLGGPLGVYQEPDFPCLRDELRLLARRLAADLPTLGICLGAQLMARVLGARVAPGPAPEIGWAPVALTAAGSSGPTRHLADVPVLHWHGDLAGVPAHAERLAYTELCSNQAFSSGPNILGLQFHAEVTAAAFERWLIGHVHEVAALPALSIQQLRADAERYAGAAAEAGRRCLAAWLDGLAA